MTNNNCAKLSDFRVVAVAYAHGSGVALVHRAWLSGGGFYAVVGLTSQMDVFLDVINLQFHYGPGESAEAIRVFDRAYVDASNAYAPHAAWFQAARA